LLSPAFRWESLQQWDLGHNLLLSLAFRWESLEWRNRPQLILVSGLLVGIPSTVEIRLSRSRRLSRSLSRTFCFTQWNSGYHVAFHELFLSHNGILAITEPFTNFFFHTMEFCYHVAFHELFLSGNGILTIMEPFTNFFFHTMEFWLSRSLSRTFSFTQLLTVYFGTPNMFITLWFGFVYGTNPSLGTLII
jgi:hypothetical protein